MIKLFWKPLCPNNYILVVLLTIFALDGTLFSSMNIRVYIRIYQCYLYRNHTETISQWHRHSSLWWDPCGVLVWLCCHLVFAFRTHCWADQMLLREHCKHSHHPWNYVDFIVKQYIFLITHHRFWNKKNHIENRTVKCIIVQIHISLDSMTRISTKRIVNITEYIYNYIYIKLFFEHKVHYLQVLKYILHIHTMNLLFTV